MSVTVDTFVTPFERLLEAVCTPARIREIEAGADCSDLWSTIHESGFLDALTPEAKGGAGMNLHDVFPLIYLCGKHAAPAPIAQTLIVRAILAMAGHEPPAGPITIAGAATTEQSAIEAAAVPYGRVAEWVALNAADRFVLLPVAAAVVTPTGVHGSLEANLRWERPSARDTVALDSPIDARALGASVYAAQLAGAMTRALDITVRYANERSQFGRAIGKFQAIQHQLSVMAEQTSAARMAAEIACSSTTHLPDPRLAAVGKARTSEAAATVAAIGHAVHGAMGFTAEYELQLYTRRLHEWRLAYGAEGYWTQRIGSELLTDRRSALQFIRDELSPRAIAEDA